MPRPVQRQLLEPQPHDGEALLDVGVETVLREQRHRLRRTVLVGKDRDRAGPRPLLAVVDLAQVQHVPLAHATVGQPAALDDAPVGVFLAVLPALDVP